MTESPEATQRPRWRRRAVIVPVAIIATVVIAGTAFATEPWTVFTDPVVDEALPVATGPGVPGDPQPSASITPSESEPGPSQTATSSPSSSPTPAPTQTKKSTPSPQPSATKSQPPAEPVVLVSGSFISHEEATKGTVRILKLADGSRVLRIEDLDTSQGPALHVWITDAPVIKGEAGWSVFDDGAYVDLGPLKGNKGNQNYPLPAGVDLDDLTSVSIWCEEFRVSFGAASLG